VSNRCDQCKHWVVYDGYDWEAMNAEFGLCRGVRERWKITDEASKDRINDRELRAAALKEAKAYVQDGSEYVAQLVTAPDFFCALYEAKT
jgi:hypothetical protein